MATTKRTTKRPGARTTPARSTGNRSSKTTVTGLGSLITINLGGGRGGGKRGGGFLAGLLKTLRTALGAAGEARGSGGGRRPPRPDTAGEPGAAETPGLGQGGPEFDGDGFGTSGGALGSRATGFGANAGRRGSPGTGGGRLGGGGLGGGGLGGGPR